MPQIPQNVDIAKLQAAMKEQQQKEAERRMKLHDEAGERLEKAMEESADLRRLAALALFGHRLVNWASMRASEMPDVSAMMVGILYEAQQHAAGKMFDFPPMLAEFNQKLQPWLNAQAQIALERDEGRKARMKKLTGRIKSKAVPLPLDLDRKFENGMTHEDIFPIFSHSTALPIILALFTKVYERAGGRVVVLHAGEDDRHPITGKAGEEDVHASKVIALSGWRGKGDTVGQLVEVLRSSVTDQFNPSGLLVIEDLDQLIAEEQTIEPRPARLVRSLATLQQLQFHYPIATVVGINTEHDQPQGMRPEELYPPYLTDRPHVWADFKPSQLAGGTMNVQIDSNIYPVTQLNKMLVLDDE